MDARALAQFDQAWAQMREMFIPTLCSYYARVRELTGSETAATALTVHFQAQLFKWAAGPAAGDDDDQD